MTLTAGVLARSAKKEKLVDLTLNRQEYRK